MSNENWLDQVPETRDSITLDASRTMGTGVWHMHLPNGWSVSAVPQWLVAGEPRTYMPVVNPPDAAPHMLVNNTSDTLAGALKTAIRYRWFLLDSEMSDLSKRFF